VWAHLEKSVRTIVAVLKKCAYYSKQKFTLKVKCGLTFKLLVRSECYTYKFDSERGVFLFFSQICIKTKEKVIKIDKNVLKFLKFVFFRFLVRKY
jgi:hypothetical protein